MSIPPSTRKIASQTYRFLRTKVSRDNRWKRIYHIAMDASLMIHKIRECCDIRGLRLVSLPRPTRACTRTSMCVCVSMCRYVSWCIPAAAAAAAVENDGGRESRNKTLRRPNTSFYVRRAMMTTTTVSQVVRGALFVRSDTPRDAWRNLSTPLPITVPANVLYCATTDDEEDPSRGTVRLVDVTMAIDELMAATDDWSQREGIFTAHPCVLAD